MIWWQAMLWGMAGGAVWRVTWNLVKSGIVAGLDARLDRKREAMAKQAVANPEAVAERLGLPIEVVRRYAEGRQVKDRMDSQEYKPG
ncbi:hypothetical protein SEA_ARCHIMEDES_59 [Gordonia phage Archimedes]|uniref:Uncharacterized protein n=1 Tax=Gordonia phage Archimedes TaxID=2759389 RepID=A0A7L7SSR6_9CAUD|nr:hypothetical protein KCH38_gp59 [Gordonia phage Archimedes]QOC55759.1 hypothetical protein SEA_ARCHIMEDES_59 [Gordonia phage Archimedes]